MTRRVSIWGESKLVRAIFAPTMLIVASGCASVKVPLPGFGRDAPQAGSTSQVVQLGQSPAVEDARQSVSVQPWGPMSRRSVADVFLGSWGRVEQEAALERYLSSIGDDDTSADAAVLTVLADADHALAQARRLAHESDKAASRWSDDRVADEVAVFETAIGDIRASRDMYLNALKMLNARGASVRESDIRAIHAQFTDCLRAMGAAADRLAAHMDGTPATAPAMATTREAQTGVMSASGI